MYIFDKHALHFLQHSYERNVKQEFKSLCGHY